MKTSRILMYGVILMCAAFAQGLEATEELRQYPECGLPSHTIDHDDNRARPPRPTLSGPVSRRYKTHVVVHYTISGSDATTASYAESVAVYAESCWVRAEALGWAVPPPDQGVGYDDRFDVYMRSTANIGAYGVCYDDSNYTNPYPDGYSSWIEITKDSVEQPFPRYDRLKALVAHEFHHGCQMRYSRSEEPFWSFYENTTVWMEDLLMPGYGTLYWRNSPTTTYTWNPLTITYWPINETSGTYEYPGSLWAKFLAEYYASYCVRYIWWCCGYHTGSHLLYDTDSILRTYFDSDLQKALGHYAIWRYFSGNRDDNLHFVRADECTTSFLHASHSTYPVSGTQGTHYPTGPGGMNLVEFITNGNQNLYITFNGENGYDWAAYVICRRGATTYEQKIPLSSTGYGTITIPSWMITTAVLVPVVVHWSDASLYTPALDFTYDVSVVDGELAVNEHGVSGPYLISVAPNPMHASTRISYALKQGESGILNIFDISGRLVKSYEVMGTGKLGVITWARQDQSNVPVPSGVYFCQFISQGTTFQKKIVVQ